MWGAWSACTVDTAESVVPSHCQPVATTRGGRPHLGKRADGGRGSVGVNDLASLVVKCLTLCTIGWGAGKAGQRLGWAWALGSRQGVTQPTISKAPRTSLRFLVQAVMLAEVSLLPGTLLSRVSWVMDACLISLPCSATSSGGCPPGSRWTASPSGECALLVTTSHKVTRTTAQGVRCARAARPNPSPPFPCTGAHLDSLQHSSTLVRVSSACVT